MEAAREIGAAVRTVRRRRGLSLDVVAGLAGISRSYLAMLERGERRFETRGLLERIAGALGCSTADLTGEPYAPVDQPSAQAMGWLPQIELALLDCTLDDVPDLAVRPLRELVAAARLANEHRDMSRYDLAGQGLGRLLTELQVVAATDRDGAARRAALTALVEVCLVAYEVSKALGRTALAVQAAERGLEAARLLDDPALIGFAGWYRSLALMRIGAHRRAGTGLAEVITQLATVADPTATDTLAAEVYGLAQLTRALLAARDNDPAGAREHLDEASRIAGRTGDRNSLLQHFGPTNVAVWRVSVGVELQLAAAVYEQARAAQIDPAVLGSATRVAALNFDLARALAQVGGGRDMDAIRHLDIADQTAPQRIRHDPIARELLAELDHRAHRTVWELESLKRRFRALAS